MLSIILKSQQFKKIVILSFILIGFVVPFDVDAFRTSTNFRILSDSVNSGGTRSTSTNYIVNDTVSESATGEDPTSASFTAQQGFPAIFEEPAIRVTISTSSITLDPSLRATAISSGSYTITVATNGDFGYTLQVTEDGEFRSGASTIPGVSDGTVTQGQSEYGISVSGTDAAFNDHREISGLPLTIASRTTHAPNITTTVTHLASVQSGTQSATYSHVVTYIVIANY